MSTPVNGLFVYNGVTPSQIASAPVGVKVIQTYDDNGNLFSNAQVSQMESGGGSLLGYFSIGEAATYEPFWSTLPSAALGPEDTAWPGTYQVAYWTPQWLGVAENYIKTMIGQGFNGVFFDCVDEAETSWAQQNAPGQNPEGAMVTLIQQLSSYAHAQNPNFQLWINAAGAEPMLTNGTLLDTISGAVTESMLYQNGTQAVDQSDSSYVVSALDNVTKAGKPVIDIEYVSGASEVASVEAQDKANGFGWYIANPDQALNGVDTQGFTSDSSSGTAPAVKITSAGATTTTAAQTIKGTVDVADAGSTVKILDGTKQIGSTTVAASGAWSANVTLANTGANVLTATDANASGTGTSNAVTYTLQSSTPPSSTGAKAPTLSIANHNLTVAGGGGTVGLGVGVKAPASSTATSVTITGLPQYDRIVDTLDHDTFKGSSVTLTAAEVDSGLTLRSRYNGGGSPSSTLTITATDTMGGVSYVSAAQTIVVKNASASASGALAKAIFPLAPSPAADPAGGVASQGSGQASAGSDLAAALSHDRGAAFGLGHPAPVDGDGRWGANIFASAAHHA